MKYQEGRRKSNGLSGKSSTVNIAERTVENNMAFAQNVSKTLPFKTKNLALLSKAESASNNPSEPNTPSHKPGEISSSKRQKSSKSRSQASKNFIELNKQRVSGNFLDIAKQMRISHSGNIGKFGASLGLSLEETSSQK